MLHVEHCAKMMKNRNFVIKIKMIIIPGIWNWKRVDHMEDYFIQSLPKTIQEWITGTL